MALYEVLLALAPSPVDALNHAVAVAMRDGPAAGLALLEGLVDEPQLCGYHPYQAARADLLYRLGRADGAAAAYREALASARTEPEPPTSGADATRPRARPQNRDDASRS